MLQNLEVIIKTLIAFGILLLVSFVGSIKLFKRIKTYSSFSYLFYSGTIYIFFGLLIGENCFNLLSSEITLHLEPVINFALGWVGFIFGHQIEVKYLKRIKQSWYIVMFFTFFAAFIFIFFISLLAISHFVGTAANAGGFAVGIAFLLAILLAESSIPFVVWSSKLFKKQPENHRLCVFISSLDNFFPILFTGIVFSLYRFLPVSNEIILNSAGNFIISFTSQLLLGMVVGAVIYLLQRGVTEKYQISTILLGLVFFIAGLSLIFSYSMLFTAMVSGVVFSNLSKSRSDRIISILGPTEKPVYLIFLIILGVKNTVFTIEMLLFAVILLVIKFNSRIFTFALLQKVKPRGFKIPRYFSYLLLPIGSIAPAILLDMQIAFPHEIITIISGIFIVCFILAELFAPAGLRIAQRSLAHD